MSESGTRQWPVAVPVDRIEIHLGPDEDTWEGYILRLDGQHPATMTGGASFVVFTAASSRRFRLTCSIGRIKVLSSERASYSFVADIGGARYSGEYSLKTHQGFMTIVQ